MTLFRQSMNINFSYSYLAEYQRLIYNIYNVEIGFYKNEGMLLYEDYLDYPNTVVIPRFKCLNQIGFWIDYEKFKKEIPKNYINFIGDEFSILYKDILKQEILNVENIKKDWDNVDKNFVSILETLFQNDLDVINVYLTYFGTVASYNHNNKVLNIYIRKDADISQIAFCILSYFIHKYKGDLTWREQQRAVDFLMLNTKLNELFPKFVSILDSSQNPEIDLSLILNSEQIYKNLGINITSSIEIKGDKILILKEELFTLTKQEKLVLHELIKNKNQITTFEQISNIIWGDDFSIFSLQAIAKTIERIRLKILTAGLNRQVIFTRRKFGYILYD